MREVRTVIALAAAAMALTLLAGLSRETRAQEQELVDRGRFLYEVYCGNCHGERGKGDGPTSDVLKVKPSDLSRLSKGNSGEFPFAEVYRTIDGRARVRGHGKSQMPIWGLSFQEWDKDANQEDEVRGKILQLIEYLKTLQVD